MGGREAAQPRQPQRQQVAALRQRQRMQFVEHHAAQVAEQMRRVGRGGQQRELFGRRQQHVRRVAPLALALLLPTCRRCASRSGRAGSFPRPAFRDCDGRRRPAPSTARCRACAAARPAGWRARPLICRSAKAGSPPASCRRRSARSAARRGPARLRAPARAGAAARTSRAPQTRPRIAQGAGRRRSRSKANARPAGFKQRCESMATWTFVSRLTEPDAAAAYAGDVTFGTCPPNFIRGPALWGRRGLAFFLPLSFIIGSGQA